MLLQTPTFKKTVRKLHPNQKKDLDKAVKAISNKPTIGEKKKGELSNVRVYKFKMVKQLILLAYTSYKSTITLLALGSHVNFYRDLKINRTEYPCSATKFMNNKMAQLEKQKQLKRASLKTSEHSLVINKEFSKIEYDPENQGGKKHDKIL
jgi:mRNA-degrading endonuclease RelE of RelBE toxin-antitoxin system